MIKKTLVLSFGMCLLFFFSCTGTEKEPEIRSEIINGTKNVFNSYRPLKGEISLDLEKTVEIDSVSTRSPEPVFFDQVDLDSEGTVYLSDSRNLKIHKFKEDGTWISSFSISGEGPGEFSRMGDLQIVQNEIWIAGNWPLQIARYNPDGTYVSDWRSERFYNYYLQPIVLDENRFLSVGFQQQEMAGSPERRRISALRDFDENVLQTYFIRLNVGPMILTVGNDPPLQVSFTNASIVPRILHAYDRGSGILYVFLNLEYRIELKDLGGDILLVVHKDNENRRITERDRDELVPLLTARLSPKIQEEVKERLPDSFCAISGLTPLCNGHFAVHRVTGVSSIELDIFDREGKFIHTVLASEEVPSLISLRFFDGRVGWIEHLEDRDVYHGFEIKNLPQIFKNSSAD
jgi:hypothetical protein